jgi:hypothetical protein
MTELLTRLLDAIPTPTPEQGDKLVGYTCVFGLGFCVAILVLGA